MRLIMSGLLVLMLISACASGPVTPETPAADLFLMEKLAAEAYQNSEWLVSEKHYSILVEKDPEKAFNWLRLGNIYARTDRPDAAILAYREALVREPKLVNAWYNMGIIQLKQAAYSFNEMQLYADPDNPVTAQSQQILEGVLKLIQGETP